MATELNQLASAKAEAAPGLDEFARALLVYGDLAGSEAITRALVAERTGDRDRAIFWLDVFSEIVQHQARQTI